MAEMMSAIRIKDGAAVRVAKVSSIRWVDIDSKEEYILHIDIELLY